jgi:SAM-dependent MidA family methyltransferase
MNLPLPEPVMAADLPRPDAAAQAHSRRLARLLLEEIDAAGGSIDFHRYMELVLYAPGFGYYSAGAGKIGPGGDFITAPELSPLFSRCIANQCDEILLRTGGGVILELGAGTGRMALDILMHLERNGTGFEEYLILETSADLRERQGALLAEQAGRLCKRVRWLDRLPEVPIRGVILANEVLDAMPVHRLRFSADGIRELRVAPRGNGFAWCEAAVPAALLRHVQLLPGGPGTSLPEGYTTEFNCDLGPWVAAIGDCLECGILLVTDYGYPRSEYYHPQRRDGALLCHYRHRAHDDPFLYPGLQDITAPVDFTLLAEAGHEAGFDVCGFTTQANFLIGCGLPELVGGGALADAQQAKWLTLPGEMGESFKAMALGRRVAGPLRGFRIADHRYRL